MPDRKFSENDYAANVGLMESGQAGSRLSDEAVRWEAERLVARGH